MCKCWWEGSLRGEIKDTGKRRIGGKKGSLGIGYLPSYKVHPIDF